jgi:hypothetical protein
LNDSRPVSYQMINGQRVDVSSQYVLPHSGGTAFGFAIAAGYDPVYPLVIDPDLDYSTYWGSASNEEPFGIAVDEEGHAFVTGAASGQVFVIKFAVDGSGLEYETFLGTGVGEDIAVDAAGNAYITGETSGGYPTTSGAFDETPNGLDDVFVTKLDPTGDIVYSTLIGGALEDQGRSIAIGNDATPNAFITGVTFSTGVPPIAFPTTPGAFDVLHNGLDDAFVTQLNATGSALVYSTFLGGALSDVGRGIAVDGQGRAYVAGFTDSLNFPVTPGAFDEVVLGRDAFVTKLNEAGSALEYSTVLGGLGVDEAFGIDVQAQTAYVTGRTSGDFPTTPGAYDRTYNGGPWDAFVTRLDPQGTNLLYSTYLGGDSDDRGEGIAVQNASAFVTGRTNSAGASGTGFPTTGQAHQQTYGGGLSDAFLSRLNGGGSRLQYSTFLGGMNRDQGRDVAVKDARNPHVTGFTTSGDFDTTPGAYDETYNGARDVFVTKFDLRAGPQ